MIGDVGHAKELESSTELETSSNKTSVFGTNKYMPPEYHDGGWKENSKAIDIW